MLAKRPLLVSRFILFTLTILLFHLIDPPITTIATEDDDLEVLEALLAVDEELEREEGTQFEQTKLSSEAGVVSRAQRIVLELSNENAKKVLEGNEYVLLLGYTPWCEKSAELMPRFAEAATVLKEMGSGVILAKLDCERHAKAAGQLGIKGFPALLLFVNGTSQAYRGGYTMEEIVIWARKKTGAPTIRVSSVDSAKAFLTKHQTFIIGVFNSFEGPEYREFLKAAIRDNEIQFVETEDIEVAEILFPEIKEESSFLGLVKSEPERFLVFDEKFEEETILRFLELNKFPLLTSLTEVNSNRVYSSIIKLQVFVIAELDDMQHLLVLVQDVARKYRTKVMFIHVDSGDDNLAKPFLTLFGIEAEKPIVVAFDNRNGSKYLLQSDITRRNLEDFSTRLLEGSLPPYYRSEQIPKTKEIVNKVVGRTFDEIVLQSHEDVFLEVHTPWCMECEATSKKVEKLAVHFKGRSNLIISRINAALNEHPKLQITAYPTLLYYPSGDKSNPIKLSKKWSLKNLIDFIEKSLQSRNKLEDEAIDKDEL